MARTREEKIREELRLILIQEYGIGSYHHIPCGYLVDKIINLLKSLDVPLEPTIKNE